jgi:hypothetical protein
MKTAAIVAGLCTLSCVSAYTANRPSVLQTGDVRKPSNLYVIIVVFSTELASLHYVTTDSSCVGVSFDDPDGKDELITNPCGEIAQNDLYFLYDCMSPSYACRIHSCAERKLLQAFSCGNMFCCPAPIFGGKGEISEIGRISGNYWNSRAQRAGG